MRLLIVGFGPFPRVPVNPSGGLARRIARLPRLRRVLGTAPTVLVMRTAYASIASELEPLLAQQPDAVLMIGVAARAKRIRVESRASNRASRLFPDAGGAIAGRLVLDPDGPPERRSAEARHALVVLSRSGLAAAPSRDAGRYLCNASYYRALAEGCPALFLHIPLRATGHRPVRRAERRRLGEPWAQAFAQVALGLMVRARSRPRRYAAGGSPGSG